MYQRMDQNFQHRDNARIIAYIELILTVISVFIPIGLLSAAIFFTSASIWPLHRVKPVVFMWIAFVLFTVRFIITFVSVLKLMDATRIGKDGCEGGKQCRFWRNVNIVFTVLGALSFVVLIAIDNGFAIFTIFTLIEIGYNSCAIFIVQKFIQELEGAASAKQVLPSHQAEIRDSVGMVYVHMPPSTTSQNGPSLNCNDAASLNEQIAF